MTLNQLSYFIATCNNGNSMTKASRELFVTQSAISLAIRDLEREFNVQLFFRNKNQLYLTEAGRRFFDLAKQVVDAAEQLRDTYREEIAHSSGMRLGMSSIVQKTISHCITADEWGQFSPYAIQSSYILDTPSLRRLLDTDKIDLVVAGSSQYDDIEGYDSVVICERHTHLYTSADGPLAARTCIAPEELMEEPILLYWENSDGIETALEFMQRFVPNLQLNRVAGYTTFLNAVEDFILKGQGSVLLAEDVLYPNDRIAVRPIQGCKPFQIIAFWKKQKGLSAPANRYIEYLSHILSRK